MSKTSLKFAFKEERFNLKMIIFILLLIDLFLLPYFISNPHLWVGFWFLLIYEISIIFSFMLGIRGQGRYKDAMMNLQSIARNKNLSIDEREAKLVSGIHHHCLELGYLYNERNKEYGLHFIKRNNNNHFKKKDKEEDKTKRIIVRR